MATYHLVGRDEVQKLEQFIWPNYGQVLQNPSLFVYCAKEEACVVGALALLLSQDVATIVSLAVSPDYQRQGIGLGLVNHVQAAFEDYDCKELQVTLSMDLEAYVPLIGLFFDGNFQESTAPPMARTCKLRDLLKGEVIGRALQKPNPKVRPLETVPNPVMEDYTQLLGRSISWSAFDGELSMVAMVQGKAVGSLGIFRKDANTVSIGWLHVIQGYQALIVDMMARASYVVAKKIGADCRFSTVLLNDASKNLLNKLIPAKEEAKEIATQLIWKP